MTFKPSDSEFPLLVGPFNLRVSLRLLSFQPTICHFPCCLSNRPHSRLCGARIPRIMNTVVLQEQRRSPGLGVTLTSPPHASTSLIWLIALGTCPIAKRPRDLETRYQRFRLQRHSQRGWHEQVEELKALLPL
ncbi:hypothetical protein BGZ60DRAFT_279310 [Tricladium varicosporioides]|nr:hypothetical protein BGZ60DRAFT_279310 [Hymenoscyphus varicosporioides]